MRLTLGQAKRGACGKLLQTRETRETRGSDSTGQATGVENLRS